MEATGLKFLEFNQHQIFVLVASAFILIALNYINVSAINVINNIALTSSVFIIISP